MHKQIKYPVFRKYTHGNTYFKVISEVEFEEVQIVGTSYNLYHITAKIFPERNYINDLVFNHNGHWEAIEEAEYNEKKEYCEMVLKRFH